MKQKLLSLVVTFVAMFAWTSVKAEDITVNLELNSSYVKDNVYTFTDANGITFTIQGSTVEFYNGVTNDHEALYLGEGVKGQVKNAANLSWQSPAGKAVVVTGISFDAHANYTSICNCMINGTPNGETGTDVHDLIMSNQKNVSATNADGFDSGVEFNFYFANAKYGSGTRKLYIRHIKITYTLSDAEVEADLTINPSAEYGTFVAPFEVTLPDGVTAYTIDSTTGTSTEDGVANFTAIEGNVLPACTPAVVYKVGGQETVIYKGVPTTTDETVTGANGLVGVLADSKTAPVNSYVLNYINDHTAFYIVRSDISVGKNRCYLAPQTEGAAKIAFSFGNPTAVTSVNANATVSAIYNAAGARVSAAQKGMNIIKYSDGSVKKVLVK